MACDERYGCPRAVKVSHRLLFVSLINLCHYSNVQVKASLVMELKDDSKATFIEAIGLSTYSNSKAGVSSYIAIFENL